MNLPKGLENVTLEQVQSVWLPRHLREYMKRAWPIVDADQLIWSWHNDAMCEHLEAVTNGQIDELLINIPPGASKSLTTSVNWQTWEWTKRPEGRWFFASYDQDLSTRDSLKCRNLITSKWYQDRWGHVFKLSGDQNLKTHFENDKKGWRIASSIGGHGLGEHPDRIVVDDPLNREKAYSDVERKAVLTWWDQTMSTRGAARGVRKVIIMQRLHEEDLSGHVLNTGNYVHLCLPMRYEPRAMIYPTKIGWSDPRTIPGELLAPEQYPEPVVAKLETTLGPYEAASQLQQRPSPAGGGYIKRDWIVFWAPQGSSFPPVRDKEGREYSVRESPQTYDQMLLSLDCSFKDEAGQVKKGQTPDPVSCGAWGRSGANLYLVDRIHRRADIVDTCVILLQMSARWPKALMKLVEDKANGPAVMAILRNKVQGLIPVSPDWGSKKTRVLTAGSADKDKAARAMSMVALFHARNVHVPHPIIAPWVWEYVEQICGYPTVPHDDDVDMTSQALLHLQPGAWAELAKVPPEKLLKPDGLPDWPRLRQQETKEKFSKELRAAMGLDAQEGGSERYKTFGWS